MKTVYVSHSRKINDSEEFDFKNELYAPLRNSRLNDKVKFVFPHEDSDKPYNSKDLFLTEKDNLIVLSELSYDSKGREMELGMAHIMGIPVIAIYKPGSKISGSQRLPVVSEIEYNSVEEIIGQLEKALGLD
jgi:hypothetical protein